MKRHRFLSVLISWIFIVAVSSGAAIASDTKGIDVSSPASQWPYMLVDWTREVGYNVSVAVDPETGHSYVSYYEGIDGDLWLARTGAPIGNCGPNNTWECQVVDINGIVGKFSSIAIGGPGPVAKLYISYFDVTNGSLRVFDGTVDRRTGALAGYDFIVDQGNPAGVIFKGKGTSIAVDGSGNPHIGYRAIHGVDHILQHATKVAPGVGNCGPADDWQCSYIEYGASGDSVDIELSPDGVPSIAFHKTGSSVHSLGVATQVHSGGSCSVGDQWRCDYIYRPGEDLGEYVSLAIGPNGIMHVAYRNSTTSFMEWARYVGVYGNCGNGASGDDWLCTTIEPLGPGDVPGGIALEIGHDGHPIIAYHDVDVGPGDLNIARPLEAVPWATGRNCGLASSPWYCETLDPGAASHDEAHGGLDMALNANGEAIIAYRELFYPSSGGEEGRLAIAVDPGAIFRDGFESGDTAVWSSGRL